MGEVPSNIQSVMLLRLRCDAGPGRWDGNTANCQTGVTCEPGADQTQHCHKLVTHHHTVSLTSAVRSCSVRITSAPSSELSICRRVQLGITNITAATPTLVSCVDTVVLLHSVVLWFPNLSRSADLNKIIKSKFQSLPTLNLNPNFFA